jgi:hypothetical protein
MKTYKQLIEKIDITQAYPWGSNLPNKSNEDPDDYMNDRKFGTEGRYIVTSFHAGKMRIEVMFNRSDNGKMSILEFDAWSPQTPSKKPYNTMKVFSTLGDIIIEYIKQYNQEKIEWTATHETRALYDMFMRSSNLKAGLVKHKLKIYKAQRSALSWNGSYVIEKDE